VAVDDQAIDQMNALLTFDGGNGNPPPLQANDTDPDGDPLRVIDVGQAVHGSVSLDNGIVTFTPEFGYFRPARFEYTVSRGQATDTGVVHISIMPVYIVSAASSGTLTNSDGSTIDFTGSDLLRLSFGPGGAFQYQKYFNGADVGLTTADENIDAFALLPTGE